jgi:DNA-3-methyladenine glycosylase
LQRGFYERDVLTVSKDLLGKILVHDTLEGVASGRIVETEAYRGPEDLAAHSSGGRHTRRNEMMYGEKGHAYIYFIYGMYWCFNVTAGGTPRKPEAVLVRALEPLEGKNIMAKRRGTQNAVNLSNGPAKLCMAMGLSKAQNKADLTSPPLFINDAPPIPAENIVSATRIGVDYAGKWKDEPWRFYIKDNHFVSTYRKLQT